MIKAFEILFLIIWATVGIFYRIHLNGQGIEIPEEKSRFLTIVSGPIVWIWDIVWFVILGFIPIFEMFDGWIKTDNKCNQMEGDSVTEGSDLGKGYKE